MFSSNHETQFDIIVELRGLSTYVYLFTCGGEITITCV